MRVSKIYNKTKKTSEMFCEFMNRSCEGKCPHTLMKAFPGRTVLVKNNKKDLEAHLGQYVKLDGAVYLLETPHGVRVAQLLTDGNFYATGVGKYQDYGGFHVVEMPDGKVVIEQTNLIEEAHIAEITWRGKEEAMLKLQQRVEAADSDDELDEIMCDIVALLRTLGIKGE